MARTETYSYGQGRVYLAERTASGDAGPMRWIGDVSALSVKLTVEDFTHKESYSGQRLDVRKIVTSREGETSMTLHEFSKENLALVLLGESTKIEAGTVTGETLPASIKAGDRIMLAHVNISNVQIGSLVKDTDFAVDEIFGAIEFLKDIASNSNTVSYSYGEADNTAIFTGNPKDLYLRYEGVNLAEENEWIAVELYKINFNPTEALELINSDTSLGSLATTAKVLADTSKTGDTTLGRFGRVVKIKKAA